MRNLGLIVVLAWRMAPGSRRRMMRYSLVLAGLAVAVGGLGLAGIQLEHSKRSPSEVTLDCRDGAAPEGADDPQPTWVILVGVNGSDISAKETHVRHLREVALPAAAAAGAQVVIGTIS